jgi:hypothetical protein
MAIDDIKLSGLMVTEWYGDALFAAASPKHMPPVAAALPKTAPPAADAPPQTISSQFKHLGDNRRRITLLVESPGLPFLPDDQLTFLTRILEACRMTIADVAIVNHAASPVAISALKQTLQPKTILLFGIEPAAIRLPINFPLFRPQSYDDCTYLSAPTLGRLVGDTEESKLLKSKLWVCLKSIFDV